MNSFILKNILKPFIGRWMSGFLLLLFWTVAFVALPAISGWFLASCSLAFITANALFAYIVPSAVIRLLTLLRTATRYFDRLDNHKTTLEVQRSLQLKIFMAVARLPYFNKQVNSNTSILENSTYGIDQVLNHILLWLLPFTAFVISILLYACFLHLMSAVLAIVFLVSASLLLFIVPQVLFMRNRRLYKQLKVAREANNHSLVESFRGRIEITKYNLEGKVIGQQQRQMEQIQRLEGRLQLNSFSLQMLVGFGFGCLSIVLLWVSGDYGVEAPMAIGIFFGILAQAELSEMLFSGKSERGSVVQQIGDIRSILKQGGEAVVAENPVPSLNHLVVQALRAVIPGTPVLTEKVSLEVDKGGWVALYGETGKGKSTLLNSLFYPEYRHCGAIVWNGHLELDRLPVPECVYVTQKAYLLTGTLRENFEGYTDDEIVPVLTTVDLERWFQLLPNGLDSWIGENGETLSGGQRKKLLLAQALLKNPQLLVVDEPTAGIGVRQAISIFRNIKHQHPDITILMATHLKDFEKEVDLVVRI